MGKEFVFYLNTIFTLPLDMLIDHTGGLLDKQLKERYKDVGRGNTRNEPCAPTRNHKSIRKPSEPSR